MARFDRPRGGWRRWLFGSDAWWRIVAAGIVAGVAVAFLAALVAAFVGGGTGSLDDEGPTAMAPASGPVDGAPVDTAIPAEETPAPTWTPEEAPATEMPVETPPAAPTATEEAPEPTETPAPEEPTPEGPTPEGGAGVP